MKRRQFVVAAVPLLLVSKTGAQPAARNPVRVAILSPTTQARYSVQEKAFLDAMGEMGWIEGRNVVYERAYTNDDPARLPSLAAQLIDRSPHVIWLTSSANALAVARKTRSIPIVAGTLSDPVEVGLVKSLARPGGNVTGIQNIGWELAGKRLQLLKQFVPDARRVVALADPQQGSTPRELELLHKVAPSLGLELAPVMTADLEMIDEAIAKLGKAAPDAMLTTHASMLLNGRKKILALAAKRRIPLIGHRGQMADDGALLAYSSRLTDQIRRSAQLVDRVLKGANPADIPVEQPTKFELVVNMKTARALRLKIPDQLLIQADRVIQ